MKKVCNLIARCLVLFLVCVSAWSEQELTFEATFDNLIMEASAAPGVANTSYPNYPNSVGNTHIYTPPNQDGLFWYDYISSASFVVFDLQAIAGKTVTNAYLKLYPVTLASAGAASRTDYKVNAIAGMWYAEVTWNTGPDYWVDSSVRFEVPTSHDPTTINVTEIVRNWVDGSMQNYGFSIMDAYGSAHFGNYDDCTEFGSLEHVGGSVVPQLVVTIANDSTRVIRLTGDLNFGNVSEDDSTTRTLTIHNDGNSPLKLTGVSSPPGFSNSFGFPPFGVSIEAGSSRNVTVTFSPTEAKSYGGTITVDSDKTSGTNTRSCSGTGVGASSGEIRLSGDLNFGSVPASESAKRTLTIHNDGSSSLTVTNIIYPGGFRGWPLRLMPGTRPPSGWWNGTLEEGSSHDVTVTFEPTETESYGGTITVSSDGATKTCSCSGTGISATRTISLSGDLNFGNVTAGSNTKRTLTIHNDGNSMLTVTDITYPSGFRGWPVWQGDSSIRPPNPWDGMVLAGSSHNVTVTFAPTETESYGGRIMVSSDSTGGISTRSCSGIGSTGYAVTVINGSGGGLYASDTSVTISASQPATGKTFVSWEVSPSQFSNLVGTNEVETFTMPTADLHITAVFTSKGSGVRVIYPLAGFEEKWVAPYLWDHTEEEYSMISEPLYEPTEVEIGDLMLGRWYWLCIMESADGVNWSLAHGNWVSHVDGM